MALIFNHTKAMVVNVYERVNVVYISLTLIDK